MTKAVEGMMVFLLRGHRNITCKFFRLDNQNILHYPTPLVNPNREILKPSIIAFSFVNFESSKIYL